MSMDTLAHYGVLGMKWGKRKSKASVRISTDRKSVNNSLSKAVPTLTNKQLKTANTRLQLEKSYKDLTKKEDKIKKGHDAVKATLAIVGTATAVYNLSKNPLVKAGIQYLSTSSGAPTPSGNWAGAPKNYAPFKNGAYRI